MSKLVVGFDGDSDSLTPVDVVAEIVGITEEEVLKSYEILDTEKNDNDIIKSVNGY